MIDKALCGDYGRLERGFSQANGKIGRRDFNEKRRGEPQFKLLQT